MKMRVSIARALVTQPKLLLMDEPFAALDEITRFKLNNDLLSLWSLMRQTVIFVTHSVFESVYLSSRIIVMTQRPGRVHAEIAVDAPYPRTEAFRTSPEYAASCRTVSEALVEAMSRTFGARRFETRFGARGRRMTTRPDTHPAIRPATRAEEAQERSRRERVMRGVLPFLALALGILIWDLVVRINDIQPYVLPSPGLVLRTLMSDWALLWSSLLVTLSVTLQALVLAFVGGVALAIAFNKSRVVEYSFYPYAVILQVTPVIAIAPLLLIYLPQQAAVLACAWIVAFFPVLANTTLGLNSVDRNLAELFRLYGASGWQVLRDLKLPAALPYMLGGLKIAGGLSLIGAVVAEIAAGSAGAGSGLAYRIAESGYRLNIPRMFAALILLSIAGVVIFAVLSLVSHLILRRWHESAVGEG